MTFDKAQSLAAIERAEKLNKALENLPYVFRTEKVHLDVEKMHPILTALLKEALAENEQAGFHIDEIEVQLINKGNELEASRAEVARLEIFEEGYDNYVGETQYLRAQLKSKNEEVAQLQQEKENLLKELTERLCMRCKYGIPVMVMEKDWVRGSHYDVCFKGDYAHHNEEFDIYYLCGANQIRRSLADQGQGQPSEKGV